MGLDRRYKKNYQNLYIAGINYDFNKHGVVFDVGLVV